MTIEITPANPSEFGAIAALWDRSWLSSGPPIPKPNDLEELIAKLRSPGWEMWAARDPDRIVAFVAIDRAASWLAQLFVDPDAQNRGIGLCLFRLATEQMPDGFSFRTDETNVGARRFYEKHGCTLDRIADGRAYYIWQPGVARSD